MPQIPITIINKLGLHARASAKLCRLAGSFPCEVKLAYDGKEVNAKSILGVMTLAAGLGKEVVLTTEGEQGEQALEAIKTLFNNRFDEGE